MFQICLRVTRERTARPLALNGLLVLLCVAGPGAAPVRAEEGETRPGWSVGLDAGFDLFEFSTDSSVESAIAPRESGSQSESFKNSGFRFGLEVVTPAVGSWPGRPRLFGEAGGILPFVSDETLFLIGGFDNGEPEAAIADFEARLAAAIARGCETSRFIVCPTADPEDFPGQGSEIDVGLDPAWYASVGVAFDFDMPYRLLFRLKPSVEYSGSQLTVNGKVTTVVEPSEDEFNVIRSTADDGLTSHRLGPGMELELVLSRTARPIAASLFFDMRFMWSVGNRSVTFTDSGGIAKYHVDLNNGFGVGGGARLTWMAFGR